MKHTLALILAALVFTALPAPVAAQQARCLDRARVLDMLENRFGETRRAMGVAHGNAVVEVFASAESGNWTITVTLPGGMTCLLASGHGFENMEAALPGLGTPA
jgi:hypothetical protein